VASTRVVRDIRLEATVQGYWLACDLAKKYGAKPPLPVIQGQSVDSYLKCVESYCLRDDQWTELVGLGSVCRRNVYGPNGIATVIDALDKVLPAHVRLHLFGVKGQSLQRLGAHPRFATVDSQAWDYSLRAEQRTGRTQQMRVQAMLGWHARQSSIVPDLYEPPAGAGEQLTFGMDAPPTPELIVHTAVADWYSTWLLAGHGYREVAWMALEQAQTILVKLRHAGPEALAGETDEATIAAYDALAAAGPVPQRE
jgi:hypothetical protein